MSQSVMTTDSMTSLRVNAVHHGTFTVMVFAVRKGLLVGVRPSITRSSTRNSPGVSLADSRPDAHRPLEVLRTLDFGSLAESRPEVDREHRDEPRRDNSRDNCEEAQDDATNAPLARRRFLRLDGSLRRPIRAVKFWKSH
jgi:hypothetical protein